MFPAVLNEKQTLSGYIDEMLSGIRNAAHGLDDAQALHQPCRSTLSIAGLLKHTAWVMRSLVDQVAGNTPDHDFYGSFVPTAEESLTALLDRFDEVRPRYLAALDSLDPDEVITVPPKPWEGITESHECSRRLSIVHHVEEFARHAGHADIIREQLDGATALPLRMAVEGIPGNEYVQPWQPARRG